MSPSRSSLQALIERCGIRLERAQYDQLWAYHGMLRSANPDLNMTRIHNFENMVLKHYVDSLLVLNFIEPEGPLVDMGSGPGLPGIPLKIARPDLPMILAEPRGARAEFLGEVCRKLGLKKVEVYAGKVGAKFPLPASGVITRAVATIPETLDRVANCLAPGGRMIFMKGPDCADEIRESKTSHEGSFRLVADHAYSIPGTSHDRRLVVYERLEGEVVNAAPSRIYAGPFREATSASNPAFQEARDLLSGKGIRKQGKALISGQRIVDEVLARAADSVEGWITPADGPPPPEPLGTRPLWLRLAEPLFRELDVAGTKAPMLLVRTPEMPEWADSDPWPDGCTLFVPFQDPENVGAVIRSAAAFGVARVVLLREAAHPFHPKAARAAGTALFQVPLLRGPSIRDLNVAGAPLIALATEGPALGDEPFPDRFGLVVGVEGPGLPEHLRSGPSRRIPIAPEVESLNAAAATAIALYACSRKA